MKKEKIVLLAIFIMALGLPLVYGASQYTVLYVDGCNNVSLQWDTEVSPYPWLNNNTNNWIHEAKTDNAGESYFTFENIKTLGQIDNVTLYIECYGDDTDEQIQCVDALPFTYGTITVNQLTYDWETLDVTPYCTIDVINDTAIGLVYKKGGGADDVYVRRMYLYVGHSTIANNSPVNNQLDLMNLTDTDDMLAEYGNYHVRTGSEDKDGWKDIKHIYVFANTSINVNRLTIRFDNDTQTASVISGEWELIKYNVSHANILSYNMSSYLYPSWDSIEESDLEFSIKVVDYSGASDTDKDLVYDVDVITTLITDNIECTDINNPDRVDVGVNSQIDFNVEYVDEPASSTPSGFYPPDSEFNSISIYDSLNNNEGTDNSIVNGAGSVSFNEVTVQSENYNLYIDMNDADYTDGELTTTENIIWDRLIITFSANETSPVENNDVVHFSVDIVYDYDSGNSTNYIYDINRNATPLYNDRTTRGFNEQHSDVAYLYDITDVEDNTYGITVWVDDSDIFMSWKPPVANYVPLNYQLSITDLDDGNNMYAEYKFYTFDYDGYDGDGYADIYRVRIFINISASNYGIIDYIEDTDTFSILSGNWEIDSGSCIANKVGNNLNLTIKVVNKWSHLEANDFDLESRIEDDEPSYDRDIMQTDYFDIITSLETDLIECIDVDTPDRTSVYLKRITEFNTSYTGSNLAPPDSEFNSISIYDSLNNNMGTDNTIVKGAGSVSFAESTVKSEIYNLYIDMNDVDYTDGELTDLTETIIWDRIRIDSLIVEDGRVDVSTSDFFLATASLEYDNHLLNTAQDYLYLQINTSEIYFGWNGSYLKASYTETFVSKSICDDNCSPPFYSNEDTYNITITNINGKSAQTIHDRVITTFVSNETSPVVNNVKVKFTVTAIYDFDDSNVTLIQYDMNRNGTPLYDDRTINSFIEQHSDVTYLYDVYAIYGLDYGITVWVDDADIKMKWYYIANIVIPSLLEGAGFNNTPAYIIINWVHNTGDVDFYEIWYSTDNVTYNILNTTLLKTYTDDYLLNNGSYRYYKLRTIYYHTPSTTWYNSSFTPIDLERAWYVLTGGGVAPTVSNTWWLLVTFILSPVVIILSKIRR